MTIYMDRITERVFAPAARHYVDVLLTKILPVFDDLDGEQERAGNDFLSSLSGPPEMYDEAMEAAYDHSIEHVWMFMELKSSFMQNAVAGLYHLFERQVCKHLTREFRDHDLVDIKDRPFFINSWENANEIINAYNNPHDVTGLTLHEAWNNKDLIELREVANAVKHPPGRALQALKAMNARVTDPSKVEEDSTLDSYSTANTPIVIEIEDICRYRDAILAFWQVRGRFSWGHPEHNQT